MFRAENQWKMLFVHRFLDVDEENDAYIVNYLSRRYHKHDLDDLLHDFVRDMSAFFKY